MQLQFTKMHGIGNDFVVFDFRDEARHLTSEQVRFIADRRFGIGCDQVLIVQSPENDSADVQYRIFNSDGGEVEQCGNGARCIAIYLREHGFNNQEVITAETQKGILQLTFANDNQVRVNMGQADFSPASIPLSVAQQSDQYIVTTSIGDFSVVALSMGNPHAVLLVDDVDQAEVERLGPEIQQSSLFPAGVNVGFMQKVDSNSIRLRVYERGAGETLACGSGACAAVVAGQTFHGLSTSVNVNLRGGTLNISREGEGQPVWMTGPATTVFTGVIQL